MEWSLDFSKTMVFLACKGDLLSQEKVMFGLFWEMFNQEENDVIFLLGS